MFYGRSVLRYARGVVPVEALKTRWKKGGSENPDASAMELMLSVVVCSKLQARSMRLRWTKRSGLLPVMRLKILRNWTSLR